MFKRLLSGLALIVVLLSGIHTVRPAHATSCNPDKESCKFTPLPEPEQRKLDLAEIAKIDLKSYPLIPEISDTVKLIYQAGKDKGNNIRVLSKVGDCMTATADFLAPFSKAGYQLGDHESLQKVIDVYLNVPVTGKKGDPDSLANKGYSSTPGFNTAGILDPMFADNYCYQNDPNDSSLACEYKAAKPGIAVIMFGTNDVATIKPEDYDYYLRQIIVETVNDGIIPVLSTFPIKPGYEDKSILFNQITANIAGEYDLPMMNLYLAFESLENKGLDPKNSTHMTKAGEKANTGDLTEDGLKYGYNMRNLLTLQTLEAVLKTVEPELLK